MMTAALDRFRLDGRTALVTGASSGLGLHFGQLLAAAGACVVLGARRAENLAAGVQRIEAAGGHARAVSLDVTQSFSVAHCFDEIGAPDIVVNNAGITVTRAVLQQSEDDWDQVMATNLKGCWLVATEAARRMVAVGKQGAIVNVASILGLRVAGGVAPYAVSKAGVIQATKAMALELAKHGIRVNALLPGYVATDLNREFLESEAGKKLQARIPSRQFCELADLDGPMLLLASNAGKGMSGACVTVDKAHSVSSL